MVDWRYKADVADDRSWKTLLSTQDEKGNASAAQNPDPNLSKSNCIQSVRGKPAVSPRQFRITHVDK